MAMLDFNFLTMIFAFVIGAFIGARFVVDQVYNKKKDMKWILDVGKGKKKGDEKMEHGITINKEKKDEAMEHGINKDLSIGVSDESKAIIGGRSNSSSPKQEDKEETYEITLYCKNCNKKTVFVIDKGMFLSDYLAEKQPRCPNCGVELTK